MDAVYLACIWISGISILLMSLIIPWGIFARYVLGSGSSWPEPVAVLLMVTFTFFGAAATYRAGGHIAVGMLTDRLPEPLRWACEKLVDVAMVGICLFVMVWGEKLSLEMMRQGLAELLQLRAGMRVVSAFHAIRSLGCSRSPIRYSRMRRVHTRSRECRNWNEPAIWSPER